MAAIMSSQEFHHVNRIAGLIRNPEPTVKTIDDLPLFTRSFPAHETVMGPILNDLYLDARDTILRFLGTTREQTARAVSQTLSLSRDPIVTNKLISIARSCTERAHTRKTAIESLSQNPDPKAQRELAHLIADHSASRDFQPGDISLTERRHNASTLIAAAGNALSGIVNDPLALKALYQAACPSLAHRMWQKVCGITDQQMEERLLATVVAVRGCKDPIAIKIAKAGLRSSDAETYAAAFKTYSSFDKYQIHNRRSEKIICQRDHKHEPISTLIETASILKNSPFKFTKETLRAYLDSADPATQTIALRGLKGSYDADTVGAIINVMCTTSDDSIFCEAALALSGTYNENE